MATAEGIDGASGPLYDVTLTFHENLALGPFGGYRPGSQEPLPPSDPAGLKHRFFGVPVETPFGIGAGPLPDPRFVRAAFDLGYSVVTFKSVRTGQYPCHPVPNILPLELDRLDPNATDESIVTALDYDHPLAIANSFGIPSFEPGIWRPQVTRALGEAGIGQTVLVAFQGTDRGLGRQAFIDDHVEGVRLLSSTGAKVIEVNLSCPNEGSKELLCFDPVTTLDIVLAIRQAVPDIKLIVKVTYFTNQEELRHFVGMVGPHVDGITAINTVAGRVVDSAGNQAFPGGWERTKPGVSGRPIKHLGLDMVRRLSDFRDELGLSYDIIGLGGVLDAADFHEYRDEGADTVMSVTGAMWNAGLAREVRESIGA